MPVRLKTTKILKGITASPGYAIGRVYVLNRFHLCVIKNYVGKDGVNQEIDRFQKAIENTKASMIKTAKESVKNLSNKMSYILNPQIQLLNDPTILVSVKKIVENEHVNVEWALQETYNKMAVRFKNIKDSYIKERLHDFEMVINKVMQLLTGTEHETLESVNDPVIVVSHDISPFDTAQMATSKILGFVTEIGGKTSHTGIIASSLQIPALVGVHRITHIVQTGDVMIIDAINGNLHLHPSEENFKSYNKKRVEYIYFDKQLESEASLTAETLDGLKVTMKGNIESSSDTRIAMEHGAHGIGLFRTEFLFVGRKNFPTEEEQFIEYKKAVEQVGKYDAVIRTLDLGGDKMPYAMQDDEPEANPALGLRAIRFCLSNRQLFRSQLRALLRASDYGNVSIMYPMVGSIEELQRANRILERQKRDLRKEGIPFDEKIKVGMMVEIPSVALVLKQFAEYVDFFSIGTNDLIQYLLAIDRGNENVADLYEPLHPAVLRTLYMIIKSANEAEVPVSVCGQMSADPIYAYLLLGMGRVAELSMEAHSIPKIKRFLRSIKALDAQRDVQNILNMDKVRDIRKYLKKHVAPLLEDGLTSEILVQDLSRGLYR